MEAVLLGGQSRQLVTTGVREREFYYNRSSMTGVVGTKEEYIWRKTNYKRHTSYDGSNRTTGVEVLGVSEIARSFRLLGVSFSI